ncbi:MAG: FAD-dependent oxidoreductase, partial [Comamonadaceae bacterium]
MDNESGSGQPREVRCDVLVVGAGAGGMTAAITARKRGLDVLVVEKSQWFGGTTALSGGVLWVPGTRHAQKPDSPDEVRRYMRREAGAFYDADMVDAFLEAGPKMVEFLERETAVQFVPTLYPDYHPDYPGG